MPYPQPPFVRACRTLFVPAFRLLMMTLCKIEVRGAKNVPPYGPYFITINHVDTLDAPLVVVFWPHCPEGLTAAENFSRGVTGILMRMYGAIPLKRRQFDREALEKGLDVIRAGSPLIVAPEGTRRRRPGMQAAKPGIAFLALKAKAPIVPVGITGTETWIPSWKRFRRPHITMTIGQPFCLPDEPLTRENRHEKFDEHTTMIMKRIAAQLPPEYRGVYGDEGLS
ncbi:MAG: 1-acyl-sn-glycerol-3-phosphate acyltransferase [Chloroflexi bacterium]|nr:1-acyl-sn-glycerol-3-phosphate acyltransferase [Chloroflexota bacterium]